MSSLFYLYWNTIGLLLSRIKGYLVDSIAFSITEILVWTGLFFLLILVIRLFGFPAYRYSIPGRLRVFICRVPLMLLIIPGPFLLLLLASGQGVMGWCPAPTFLRTSLARTWNVQPLSEQEYRQLIIMFETKLNHEFSAKAYSSKTDEEVLHACNASLDTLLEALDLNRGRTVRRIKNMTGLTRLLGLSYGGPAMHDFLSGEAAIVSDEDNPVPRYWRHHAICHETAHAKGFSREMDAEILTLLALLISGDTTLQVAGYISFLQKTGEDFLWPEALKEERKRKKEKRKEMRQRQPLVRILTRVNRKLHIQNDPEKYGYRKKDQPWNPRHPYFSTVIHLLKANTIRPTDRPLQVNPENRSL
jgi:hypothetical protein